MPYTPGDFDAAHVYVQWGGKLPGGESWSCGVRMAKISGGAAEVSAGMLTGYKNAIQTFHSAAGTKVNINAKLSFVKANAISVDGHYSLNVTNEALVADVGGGVNTNPIHPNQIALAVSLTTGFSRGPAHRGRFFLPLPQSLSDSETGLIPADEATSVKGTAATWLAAMNAVDADYQVAVFSRKSGAATHRLVTGVSVGRALDTQRRRRRKLTELWN